jgi:hypothetical protein
LSIDEFSCRLGGWPDVGVSRTCAFYLWKIFQSCLDGWPEFFGERYAVTGFAVNRLKIQVIDQTIALQGSRLKRNPFHRPCSAVTH